MPKNVLASHPLEVHELVPLTQLPVEHWVPVPVHVPHLFVVMLAPQATVLAVGQMGGTVVPVHVVPQSSVYASLVVHASPSSQDFPGTEA